MEEKLQQNLHQQHLQNQCNSKQQEELKRIQEFQKHNNILSSLNLSQLNGIQNGNLIIFFTICSILMRFKNLFCTFYLYIC